MIVREDVVDLVAKMCRAACDGLNEAECAQVIAELLLQSFTWGLTARKHEYWEEFEGELRDLGGVYKITETVKG